MAETDKSEYTIADAAMFETLERDAFHKLVVGMAEAYIAAQSGFGNWRLPGREANDRAGELGRQLIRAIDDEGSRRHIAAGHDARDGNRKPDRAK